jgi:hypothetical protein
MAERASFWRRHRWLTAIALACLVVFVAFTVTMAIIAHHFQPFLRSRLVEGLQDHFHTRVELDDFRVALGNGLNGEWGIWARGKGLRIWPPQHTGGDRSLEIAVQSIPLISLNEFRFHVPLHYERGKPIRISRVRLEGLKIVVPPRSERDKSTGFESAMTSPKPTAGAGHTHKQNSPPQGAPPTVEPNTQQPQPGALSNLVVERIDCERAQLILETDKPDKLPLGFDIARLELRDVRANRPMRFEAELTNPKPKGVIHTKGNVGPWQPTDPGETAVDGSYTFDHADLATFHGIAGILASTGAYEGTLREILVDGNADVPDFRLPQFGNPVVLHTTFHAKVDGTDGDTWLDPVQATLGHSHFITRGQIVRVRPTGVNAPVTSANLPPLADFGHDIELKVDVDQGRIEDFLRLANKSPTPFLTGNLTMKASLHIPPGTEPAHERLKLDGEFKLADARFSDVRVQGKIEQLSLRGQGRPQEVKSADPNDVASEMEGAFHMADSVITLPEIHYNVPGAAIQLQGKYPLEGFMHFEGTARMQATVSQMVGGWKGWLLKPADRFFKKDGAGTEVPILIRGPHDAPEFSVDFERMKHSSPETPGKSREPGSGNRDQGSGR